MEMTESKERFLIIDDHPLFREALHMALELGFPEAVAVDAESLNGAEGIIRESAPFDLALLDLNIPGVHGTDGLIYLRKSFPRLPVLVVSGHDDPITISRVLASGASGFISKSSKKATLASAIKQVMAGEIYVPDDYDEALASGEDNEHHAMLEKLTSLTPQQFKVLQMIREGLLNKQIAYELSVGETTIKAHVSEILRKLNVVSRTQAVIEVSKLDLDQLQQAG